MQNTTRAGQCRPAEKNSRAQTNERLIDAGRCTESLDAERVRAAERNTRARTKSDRERGRAMKNRQQQKRESERCHTTRAGRCKAMQSGRAAEEQRASNNAERSGAI
jgi:hypothetical protein